MWRLIIPIIGIVAGLVAWLLHLASQSPLAPQQAPSETHARAHPEKIASRPIRPDDSATPRAAAGSAPDQESATMMITIKQRGQALQTRTHFIKLDFDGNPLPDDAESWHCALAPRTDLVWELKRFDGGLRDNEHTYSFFRSTKGSDQTGDGAQDGGQCRFSRCDAEGYVQEINTLGLCGSKRWRLPTFAELETLLDRDYYDPVINQRIFIHTRPGRYMTSTPTGTGSPLIMSIDFFNGASFGGRKDLGYHLRLVHDGRLD